MRHHDTVADDLAFPPTVPPEIDPAVAADAAVLESIGIEWVRASLIQISSMSIQAAWSMDRYGDRPEAGEDASSRSLGATMATIVALNRPAASETLSRRLDTRRWACAWHVDDRNVAVAEALDGLPLVDHGKDDTAQLRRLCEAGLGIAAPGAPLRPETAPETTADAAAAVVRPAPSRRERGGSVVEALSATAAVPAARANVGSGPPPHERQTSRNALALRLGMIALLLLCLGAAAVFLAAYERADSMESETLRLQRQAETTMSVRLSGVLEGGDYGEVQDELDAFAGLNYFQRAVVTNSNGRAIAMAGVLEGVRVGEALPAGKLNDAAATPLNLRRQPAGAMLYTWGAKGAPAKPLLSQGSWLATGFVLCASAAAAAAWLLTRVRRRRLGNR